MAEYGWIYVGWEIKYVMHQYVVRRNLLKSIEHLYKCTMIIFLGGSEPFNQDGIEIARNQCNCNNCTIIQLKNKYLYY